MPPPCSVQVSYSKHFQPMLLCAEVELGVKKAFIELTVLLGKWNKFHHPLQVHSVFYLYCSHLVQDSGAAGTGDVMHCTNSILFIQWENKVHSLGFFDHT